MQSKIYQFEHKTGVVEKLDENTQQLAKALSGGTPIIISTIQKFPFISQAIETLEAMPLDTRSAIQPRVHNRFERLAVVMAEQIDRPIGIPTYAGIHQIAMFLQLIPLEDLLEREQAIAFRGVEQLLADPLDPPATTSAN